MVAVSPNGFEIGAWKLPEGATDLVSNLCIGPDGYMYMTEFGSGTIWKIPTSAKPGRFSRGCCACGALLFHDVAIRGQTPD